MNVATVETSIIPTTHRWSLPVLTVFVLWVLVLFDPQIFLARYGAGFLPEIPKFIYMALALIIVLQAPGRVWYLPLLLFVVGAIMASLFAENIGVAQDLVVKILLLYYILAIGSLTFINSVDKTTLILHLFLWQFLWWSLHAGFWGNGVGWHPELRNEDGYGPMMVLGIGYSFYFGMAARERTVRLAAFLVAGLSLIGVVSSFARGTVIAAGVVLVYVWFRSPRKGRTFGAVVVGLSVFVVAVAILYPGGEFWAEMSTVSEGFETGTGLDRWILWDMGWRVFLDNPIFGAGAGNFGFYAAEHLWSEAITGYRTHWHFYGRGVHNVYLQVLSEFGLVGTIAFVALLVHFWKRNAELRSTALVSAWWPATRHRFDLYMLSLALETAMVAYLACGVFYNQLFVHWFYSIIIVNALLHATAKRVMLQQRALAHE